MNAIEASAGAKTSIRCENCGGDAEAHVQERVVHGHVEWSVEISCKACGLQLERRDEGLAPSPFREVLLSSAGRFSIDVQPEQKQASAWKALRAGLGLDLPEARQKWNEIREGHVYGTEVEMRHLRAVLAKEGVIAEVRRVP